MADAGYFRVISHLHQTRVNKLTQTLQGTSADQDNRFSDKEKKLMNSMRFEESLAKKVDMKKVTPFSTANKYSCCPETFPRHFSMNCSFGDDAELENVHVSTNS